MTITTGTFTESTNTASTTTESTNTGPASAGGIQAVRPGTVLVLGSTGKTGRRIVERLQALNVDVRGGSRSADPSFDWDDESTWAPAVQGVRAVYISYYPDVAAPGADDAIRGFARVAVAAGVEHLVLLSGRGEEQAELCEQLIRDAGVEWTILRSAWFNQNFSESYFFDAVLSGTIALPVGAVREPFVDADDIADVAVAVLTQDGHAGQLYELTGPRLLTFAEATAEIAKATNRPLEFVSIPIEDFAAALRAEGVPDDEVDLIVFLFTEVLDGRNASLADGVQRALGRPARDFYDYAWYTAQLGTWDQG